MGGGLAGVAEGDAEAGRREERRREHADVPGPDDQGVDQGLQRLHQDLDRAAAAHAEGGAQAEGLDGGDGAGIGERREHAGEHYPLHRAAADGAGRGALVEQHELLPWGRGRRAVAGHDRGEDHALAPVERLEGRAEDLVRERRAREQGHLVGHRAAR